MPSVYTISGAARSQVGRKKPATKKQKAARKRFTAAAKRCKGRTLKKFQACMRRELKR